MKAPRFAKLFAQFALLNQHQRREVLAALHPAAGLDRIIALIDEIRSRARRCPKCACEQCHRHGHANDLQRFRCCHCGRTFNDLTGTPLARLRLKGKWLDYLGALLDSQAVRVAAKRVGVHRNTAFRWRHRFLEWLARFHGVASHRLPNYLGWRWALDGERVTSIEQLLRIAFGVINR